MNTRAHARFAQHFGPTALLLPPLPAGVPEAIATLGALGWLTLDSVLIAHRLWCRANPENRLIRLWVLLETKYTRRLRRSRLVT